MHHKPPTQHPDVQQANFLESKQASTSVNLGAEITKAILLVNSGNPRDPDGWLVTDIYKQSSTQLGEPGWHSQHESLALSRPHFRPSCTPSQQQ